MTEEVKTLPAGEYAIVECLGHRTLIGRYAEVERFGTKMMQIEPLYCGELLSAIFVGGSSLYAFTPCSAEVALARGPKGIWDVPASLRAVLPATALPAPDDDQDPDFDPDFLRAD